MIHVIATIELVEGKRNAFLDEFRRIIKIVRDEDGCIEYGPAIDLETEFSDPPRENIVTIVEKWADVAALRAHRLRQDAVGDGGVLSAGKRFLGCQQLVDHGAD